MRRWSTFFVALAVMAVLPTSAVADVYQDCKQGEPDRRVAACTQIISKGRETARPLAEIYFHRGEAYGHKRDYDRAIADYSEAIRLHPSFARAYVNRGDMWDDKGELDRAIADLNEGIRLDPTSASAFRLRGYVLGKMGDFTRAIADYDEAIRLDPNSAWAYWRRGVVQRVQQGKDDRALADFSEAIRLDPRFAQAYVNRADTWQDTGELDRAIADLNEGIRLDPTSATAFSLRGYVLGKMGDLTRAIADYSKSIELAPQDAAVYNNRGIVYEVLGDRDRALADYDAAIRLDAKVPIALNNRGKLYETMGDRDRAIADYATVLTLPKQSAEIRQRQEIALERLARLSQPKAAAVPSGKRVALVIGNAIYSHAGVLANPKNDALKVAAVFRRLGFTVNELYDVNRAQMVEALSDFGDLAAGADWAVVFYAGHGVEMDGTNYLLPIEVRLKRDTDVALEALSLNAVLAKVDAAKQLGLVILDACRNNPFVSRMLRTAGAKRSVSQGLARVEPEGNTAVAYAARHGTEAADGPEGGHSPFTEAFLENIEKDGVEIRIFFGRVRDVVRKRTDRRQEPFLYGSLGGEQLFFVGSTPR